MYDDILRKQLKGLLEIQGNLTPGLLNDTANYIACSNAIGQTVQALTLIEAVRDENSRRRMEQRYKSIAEGSKTNEI